MFFLLLTKIDEATKDINTMKMQLDRKDQKSKKYDERTAKGMDSLVEKVSTLKQSNTELQSNFTKLEEILQATNSRCQKLDAKISRLENSLVISSKALHKTDSKLKQDIADIARKSRNSESKTNFAMTVLRKGLGNTKSKLSLLKKRQRSLESKMVTAVRKLQKADQSTRGEVTKTFNQMTRRISKIKWTSSQNRTNNFKCEYFVILVTCIEGYICTSILIIRKYLYL